MVELEQRIAVQQRDILHLRELNAGHEAKIRELESTYIEVRDENTSLKETKGALEAREEQLLQDGKSFEMEVERLRSQAHENTLAASNANNGLEMAHRDVSSLEAALHEKQAELNQARSTIESTEVEIARRTASLEKERASSHEEVDRMREQLATAQGEIGGLKSEAEKLRENLAASKDQVAELVAQLEHSASEAQRKAVELESLKDLYGAQQHERSNEALQASGTLLSRDNDTAVESSSILEAQWIELAPMKRFKFLADMAQETSEQREDFRLITTPRGFGPNTLELCVIVLSGTGPRTTLVVVSREEAWECLEEWGIIMQDFGLLFGSKGPQGSVRAWYNTNYIRSAWSTFGVLWVVRPSQVKDIRSLWVKDAVWSRKLSVLSDSAHSRRPKRKRDAQVSSDHVKRVQPNANRIEKPSQLEEVEETFETVPNDADFMNEDGAG